MLMAEYTSARTCPPVHVLQNAFLFFWQAVGDRYVPRDDNFNAMEGQKITITLTQKAASPCQHMSVTPLGVGFCTIQLVSTRYDFMEFSSQRVCTLAVSSETVSSTIPSAHQGMH